MKVTFIEHSGFMVEMEQNVLLFDYYQGEIPSFDGSKTLYVFASHSHADHYDPAIWKLKEQYRDIHYILSDDIKDNEGAVVMKAHEKKEVAGIEIETLRSNDMGVAFLVKVSMTGGFYIMPEILTGGIGMENQRKIMNITRRPSRMR